MVKMCSSIVWNKLKLHSSLMKGFQYLSRPEHGQTGSLAIAVLSTHLRFPVAI